LQKVLTGGCYTAIIGPEGNPLTDPITAGEGMVIADLDFGLITKRKRMMDSVGHYARPELLKLYVNQEAQSVVRPSTAEINPPLVEFDPLSASQRSLNQPSPNQPDL